MKHFNNIEIEYKTKIDKDTYLKLVYELFKGENEEIQTNYYFDTDDLFFINNKQMIRIRHNITKNYYELCIKTFDGEKIIEDNTIINEDEFLKKLENGFEIKNKKVNYITNLKTYRFFKELQRGTLFLDRSYYSEIVDYEIEFEANSLDKLDYKYFKDFLKSYNIKYIKIPSKSKRAIYKKIKNNR